MLGAEQPLDGSVSLCQRVGKLARNYSPCVVVALGSLFPEGDKLEVRDAEVSRYHFLNF